MVILEKAPNYQMIWRAAFVVFLNYLRGEMCI